MAYKYLVKSCGKSHPFCKLCKPELDFSQPTLVGEKGKSRAAKAWETRRRNGTTAAWNKNITPLQTLLVEHGTRNTSYLKRRLLAEGLLENICSLCDSLPEWKGKALVLILDHINGKNTDNRLSNLRLLCPNCNSQTETFAGRNIGKNLC